MQNLVLLHKTNGRAVYVNPAYIMAMYQAEDEKGIPCTSILVRGLEHSSVFHVVEPVDRIELCIREERRLPMETAEYELNLARKALFEKLHLSYD